MPPTFVSCRLVLALAMAALAALAVTWSETQAGTKSDSEVKVSAVGTKIGAGGNQTITVTLNVNSGWYIYANPVGNKDLESAETIVTVKAKVRPKEVNVKFPEGILKEDKVVGDYKIYEGKVEIKAEVTRAPGDTSPAEVTVQFQACHKKGVCLLPAKVKVTVP